MGKVAGLSTFLAVSGLVSVVVGAFLVGLTTGFVVLGLALMLSGVAVAVPGRGDR